MSEPQLWRLFLTNQAGHDLDDLPARERQRIEAGLVTLLSAYGRANIRLDLRQVQGEEGTFGLRVGTFRVLFRPDRRVRSWLSPALNIGARSTGDDRLACRSQHAGAS